MREKEEKKRKEEEILRAGIAGAGYDTVQKYGAAAKQHYVAYSGVDNESGQRLVKGLKQIANEKVNPDYKFQNIHQQAGFSAEVKDVARTNAKKIINGEKTRKIRTDDLGRVNDQLFDTVIVDENGNILENSGSQMKFLGASKNDRAGKNDAKRALGKLQSKKFEKYLEHDAKIDVPADQYNDIIRQADTKIKSLQGQLENQKNAGNSEQVYRIEEKINNLEKIKKNLRKSSLKSKEAVFARKHPGLSTAKDIGKVSCAAGIQIAGGMAAIYGSVSLVKNIVLVCRNEEQLEEATKNVAKDTLSTAAVGFGTGAAGAAVKGAMQNSKSQQVRILSKSNLAANLVNMGISATKALTRYFNNEIDGAECLETLGEQGTSMISSAFFSMIGEIAIPVPVVGGMIGGMVGYALSSATYGVLVQSLKDKKKSHEERVQIENVCEEHIRMLREYRVEVEKMVSEYLSESMDMFREAFFDLKNSLAIGDVDGFIEGANVITESFGGEASFKSMKEFNEKMANGSIFKL